MRRVNGFAAACGRVMSTSAGLPTLSLPLLRPVVMSFSGGEMRNVFGGNEHF